ncbi:MAG: magnesium transporter [Pirellulales bacterium]
MTPETTQEPWNELADLVETGTAQEIKQFLDDLPHRDVALVMSRLSEQQQILAVSALAPEDAAHVASQLPPPQRVELIECLRPATAAAILDELPSDEQADLIGDLDAERARAILEHMQPEEAADARALSGYADDVAGGLMVTEYLVYPQHYRVRDVIEDMRQHADAYRDYQVQYAYVCGAKGRLTGVLQLRDLLLADPRRPIADIMISRPLSVSSETSLDDLAAFFDRYDFLGVPVIDAKGTLLGIAQKSAVEEALGDRYGDDFLKTQGIVGGDEIRTMPLLRRSRRRLAWLSINIVLNCIAASVIALFQDTLSAVIALAIFLPIISDMSGCSGNQAVAVSLREMSLGLVRPTEVVRVWLKEMAVGLINGLALGMLLGVVAWFWIGNPYLGLVVGSALCLNTMLAVSLGGIVPLVLKRFSVDPAIASGPLLTTVTDLCGFLLVLGIATLLLERLTGS